MPLLWQPWEEEVVVLEQQKLLVAELVRHQHQREAEEEVLWCFSVVVVGQKDDPVVEPDELAVEHIAEKLHWLH